MVIFILIACRFSPPTIVRLYAFFWVILRRLKFVCRRFVTLYSIFIGREVCVYTPTCLWRWNRVLWNVGIQTSDAGELPRRKHTIFRARRKFEIRIVRLLRGISLVKEHLQCLLFWDVGCNDKWSGSSLHRQQKFRKVAASSPPAMTRHRDCNRTSCGTTEFLIMCFFKQRTMDKVQVLFINFASISCNICPHIYGRVGE